MNNIARLALSTMLGLVSAATVFLLFTYEQTMASKVFAFALILIPLMVTYVASFGTNITISAISCPKTNVGKSSYLAVWPAGMTFLATLLFLFVGKTSFFSFAFDTIQFKFSLSSYYTTAAALGLIFATFWTTLYGSIFSTSLSELC